MDCVFTEIYFVRRTRCIYWHYAVRLRKFSRASKDVRSMRKANVDRHDRGTADRWMVSRAQLDGWSSLQGVQLLEILRRLDMCVVRITPHKVRPTHRLTPITWHQLTAIYPQLLDVRHLVHPPKLFLDMVVLLHPHALRLG